MLRFGPSPEGGYDTCGITVEVSPVQDDDESELVVWSGNFLNIDSVDIFFTRETISNKSVNQRSGSFTWSKRWAVTLFLMSSIMWFFPQFEASKGITTGEGIIAAAVLLVGGLLLWFLGSSPGQGRKTTSKDKK